MARCVCVCARVCVCGGGGASILSPDIPSWQHLNVFTNQKFSEPWCLGFL